MGRRRGWPHCAESGLLPPSRSSCPTGRCRRSRGVGRTTGAGRRVLSDGPQTRARTHRRTRAPTTVKEKKEERIARTERRYRTFIVCHCVLFIPRPLPPARPTTSELTAQFRRTIRLLLLFFIILCAAHVHDAKRVSAGPRRTRETR